MGEVENSLNLTKNLLVAANSEKEEMSDLNRAGTARLEKVMSELQDGKQQLLRAEVQIDELQEKMSEVEVLRSRMESQNQFLADGKKDLALELKQVTSDLKVKESKISKLEISQNDLLEESIGLKERLAAVERDQERLENERTDVETVISEEKRIRNYTSV